MMESLRKIILSLLICTGMKAIAEARKEVKVLGIMGDALRLKCPYAEKPTHIKWADYIYNTDRNAILIYDSRNNTSFELNPNHPKKENYLVEENQSLKILSLTQYGYFTCETETNDLKAKYYISVSYMAKPECPEKVTLNEGETYSIPCKVKYGSSQLPSLDWFTDQSMKLTSADKSTINLFHKELNYTAETKAESQILKCEANLLQLTEKCYTEVHIRHPIKNIQITPNKVSYKSGEVLTCQAEGIKPLKYNWHLNDKHIGSGSTLVLTQEWLRKSNTITCEIRSTDKADQTILKETIRYYRSDESTIPIQMKINKEVNSNKQASNSDALISPVLLGAVIGAFVILCIIIIIVIVMKKLGSLKKGAKQIPITDPDIKAKEEINGKGPINFV